MHKLQKNPWEVREPRQQVVHGWLEASRSNSCHHWMVAFSCLTALDAGKTSWKHLYYINPCWNIRKLLSLLSCSSTETPGRPCVKSSKALKSVTTKQQQWRSPNICVIWAAREAHGVSHGFTEDMFAEACATPKNPKYNNPHCEDVSICFL